MIIESEDDGMALKKPVKGIFFDVGWTLLYPIHSDWYVNKKFVEHVPGEIWTSLPDERKKLAFARGIRYLNDNHSIETEDEEFEQFKVFYNIMAEDLPELNLTDHAIEEIAYSKVFDTGNYAFYDGVKQVLEGLKQEYKTGIISDTWPSIERVLRSGGIEDLFDVKIYSYRYGVCKPDPIMYREALKEMGIPARQTVFVDDFEPNLDGAAEQGIQPILIITHGEGPNSGKYPTINHISEMIDLL
jgi:putative hydrolase of the HAD superfamily